MYKKNGVKQIVVVGESNENEIIIEQGLEEEDKVFLTIPENPEKYKTQGEELVEVILQKKEQKRLEEEALKAEAAEEAAEKGKKVKMPSGMKK